MTKIRFSIRTLLVATAIVAFIAFVWINPPDNYVRIKVDRVGRISIDGVAVDLGTLEAQLSRRQLWLSLWYGEPHADIFVEKEWMLNADPQSRFLPLVKSVEDSGFASPTIVIVDRGAIQ